MGSHCQEVTIGSRLRGIFSGQRSGDLAPCCDGAPMGLGTIQARFGETTYPVGRFIVDRARRLERDSIPDFDPASP
jgi:hypothetical protein